MGLEEMGSEPGEVLEGWPVQWALPQSSFLSGQYFANCGKSSTTNYSLPELIFILLRPLAPLEPGVLGPGDTFPQQGDCQDSG